MARFANTSCSQCGCDLGPGDSGVSHCDDHAPKHTPGPWTLDPESYAHVVSDDYHAISAGCGYLTGGDERGFSIMGCVSLADARLIAAAPDLLELLQEISRANAAQVAPIYSELARAAIAKATGEVTQ